mmetsp:Transcript_25988/g.68189  ORF Transcript_25988/g.68189 Transcript_25988/m.68189 type:complete len:204 (-) Transcript_25988:123-734(-)
MPGVSRSHWGHLSEVWLLRALRNQDHRQQRQQPTQLLQSVQRPSAEAWPFPSPAQGKLPPSWTQPHAHRDSRWHSWNCGYLVHLPLPERVSRRAAGPPQETNPEHQRLTEEGLAALPRRATPRLQSEATLGRARVLFLHGGARGIHSVEALHLQEHCAYPSSRTALSVPLQRKFLPELATQVAASPATPVLPCPLAVLASLPP